MKCSIKDFFSTCDQICSFLQSHLLQKSSTENLFFLCGSTLINLHPKEYGHKLHYYSFAVNLERCTGSCNTLNDPSNIVCAYDKTDLNLKVFNMIAGINE